MDVFWNMRGAEQLRLVFSVILGVDRFQLLKQKADCWPLLIVELVCFLSLCL